MSEGESHGDVETQIHVWVVRGEKRDRGRVDEEFIVKAEA